MSKTKDKVHQGQPVFGGWTLTGHPAAAEIMLEHITAVQNADAILATPGLDAVLIGPYDLSASMGLAGQSQHPDVLAAQETVLDACRRRRIAAGIDLVPVDAGAMTAADCKHDTDQGQDVTRVRLVLAPVKSVFLVGPAATASGTPRRSRNRP